jgi:hypothetical protein
MRLLKFGCDDFGPVVEKNKAHPQGGCNLGGGNALKLPVNFIRF